MEQRYVRLTGLADGAHLRNATFHDRPHIVVPVVALVGNCVVEPMNAGGPEFVPASELASAPSGWNNRPVLPEHPDGGRASANEPHTLEALAFGSLFNTRFDESDSKLKTEAWIDVDRVNRLAEQGNDAPLLVMSRIEGGEMVEVSVGAWITAEEQPGIFNGQRFNVVWRDIVPDHLAMLPEGVEGACSIAMGAGAPRVAQRRVDPGSRSAMRLESGRADSQLRSATVTDEDKRVLVSEIRKLNMTDLVATHRRLHQMAARGNTLTGFSRSNMNWLHAQAEKELRRRARNDDRDPPEPTPLKWGSASRAAEQSVEGGEDPSFGDDEIRSLHFPSRIKIIRDREKERSAAFHTPDHADEDEEDDMSKKRNRGNESLFARVLSALTLGFRSGETSDVDLRDRLNSELRKVEPAFDGVNRVMIDSSTVIYSVSPDGQMELFQRGFERFSDGTVTLNDDRVPVEAEVVFTEKSTRSTERSDEQTDSGSDGSSQTRGRTKNRAARTTSRAAAGVVNNRRRSRMSKTRDRLIDRLVANEHSPFVEEDTEDLRQLSEGKLKALADAFESEDESGEQHPAGDGSVESTGDESGKPGGESDDKSVKSASGNASEEESESGKETRANSNDVTISKDELEDLRAAAAAHKAAQEEEKGRLIASLSVAQDVLSKDQLAKRSIKDLQELAAIVGIDDPDPDYSGRVVGDGGTVASPPDPYEAALKARRESAN